MSFYYTPIALFACFIAFIITFIVKMIRIPAAKKAGKTINYFYETVQGLFIVYLIVLFTYTLFPSPFGGREGRMFNLIPFKEVRTMISYRGFGTYLVKLCIYNVFLFVPFGFLGGLLLFLKNKRAGMIILYGFLTTTTIELIQYIMNMGRAADIDDIILNTLGTMVGYIVSLFVVFVLKNKIKQLQMKK